MWGDGQVKELLLADDRGCWCRRRWDGMRPERKRGVSEWVCAVYTVMHVEQTGSHAESLPTAFGYPACWDESHLL
eukprot:superscaffoldBa00003582_g17269